MNICMLCYYTVLPRYVLGKDLIWNSVWYSKIQIKEFVGLSVLRAMLSARGEW